MKYIFVVMTNARPGREDEFNAWYTDRHIPDILRVPGVVAAQRFQLAQVQRRDPPYPFKYLATYDIEIDDLNKTINGLLAGREAGTIPLSDAMDPENMFFIFEPVTERIVAGGV